MRAALNMSWSATHDFIRHIQSPTRGAATYGPQVPHMRTAEFSISIIECIRYMIQYNLSTHLELSSRSLVSSTHLELSSRSLVSSTHLELSSRSLVSIFLATRALEDCRRASADSFIWITDAWRRNKHSIIQMYDTFDTRWFILNYRLTIFGYQKFGAC